MAQETVTYTPSYPAHAGYPGYRSSDNAEQSAFSAWYRVGYPGCPSEYADSSQSDPALMQRLRLRLPYFDAVDPLGVLVQDFFLRLARMMPEGFLDLVPDEIVRIE